MVHSYVNISITKTTTYAFYLSSLIVLLVRRNKRNVGLHSLFHTLLISKEPIVTSIQHIPSFSFHAMPCRATQTTYSTIVHLLYRTDT